MPDVAVIVPWRPGCQHREQAWAWVRARYADVHPAWEIIEARAPTGPWCKALAVNPAVAATSADVIIVADADVWVPNLTDAVAELDQAPWVIPHRLVHRLTEDATAAVLAGADTGGQPTAERPYLGVPGGGLVIAPRTTLLDVPLDPRFWGWGQEDVSWAAALQSLTGPPYRGSTPLTHLWHPPQPRSTRKVGSPQGQLLHRRYISAARKGPPAMRQLLQEVTPCP